MCVYSHTPSPCSISFHAFVEWKNFIPVSLPLFFLLSEAAQSSLSVALLWLYNALLSALQMLCVPPCCSLSLPCYGKYQLKQEAMPYIFDVQILMFIFSPNMYKFLPSFSEEVFEVPNWILVYTLQISPACLMHIDLLWSFGQSWLSKIHSGNGKKKTHTQQVLDNHLFFLCFYFFTFGRLIWTPTLKMNPDLSMVFPANMRARKTWSLPVPLKCVPLESRWWRKWR